MRTALAVHYARALADAVFSSRSGLSPEDAKAQLAELVELLRSAPELKRALLSPAINRDKKAAVVNKLCEQLATHRLIRNFVALVLSHRRTGELASMQQAFDAVVDERLGYIPADIVSAVELGADQRRELEQALAAESGSQIRARYQVDPSLLGGVLARIGSKEYDGSLRGRLARLQQHLAAVD